MMKRKVIYSISEDVEYQNKNLNLKLCKNFILYKLHFLLKILHYKGNVMSAPIANNQIIVYQPFVIPRPTPQVIVEEAPEIEEPAQKSVPAEKSVKKIKETDKTITVSYKEFRKMKKDNKQIKNKNIKLENKFDKVEQYYLAIIKEKDDKILRKKQKELAAKQANAATQLNSVQLLAQVQTLQTSNGYLKIIAGVCSVIAGVTLVCTFAPTLPTATGTFIIAKATAVKVGVMSMCSKPVVASSISAVTVSSTLITNLK